MLAIFRIVQPVATCLTEAESKEKHGVWDPTARVDSNTFTMGSPMPESTFTLCQSRLYPPVRDFGFGLRATIFDNLTTTIDGNAELAQ